MASAHEALAMCDLMSLVHGQECRPCTKTVSIFRRMRLVGLRLSRGDFAEAKSCAALYIRGKKRHSTLHGYTSSFVSGTISTTFYEAGRHTVALNGALYKAFLKKQRAMKWVGGTESQSQPLLSPTKEEVNTYNESAEAFNMKMDRVHHDDIPRIQQRMRDVIALH